MYDSYRLTIENNLKLDYNDWYFKSDNNYKEILEHVNYSQGIEYLIEINKKYKNFITDNKEYLINICNLNDLYGKTEIENFENFCQCSPSNLRYIFHSLLIIDHIKQKSLSNVDIIEIGGGYGGLCLFIYKLSKLFDITINSYTIFDLPEPMMLQKEYLSIHNININTINLFDDFTLNKNSFLISNYAYSEISMELQKIYTQKVLNPYVSSGFLVWNSFDGVYNFMDNINIVSEKEYPVTGNTNLYVYF